MSDLERAKALLGRRAELKRTLKRLRAESAETRKALARVKAEIAKMTPSPVRLGGLRASIRKALGVRPMTTAQLAAAVMAERGMDLSDKAMRFRVQHRARASLERLKGRGVVATDNAAGKNVVSVWRLA